MKSAFYKYASATCLALVPISSVYAIGLGHIQHNSALGSPLSASIKVLGSEDLLSNEIKVAMGSQRDYQNLNVEWQHLHQSIKVLPLSKDGQLYIQLTSKQAVNEPFLNFVVTLDTHEGHSMREYTILLDLPSVITAAKPMASSQAVVSRNTNFQSHSTAIVREQQQSETLATKSSTVKSTAPHKTATDVKYQIVSGTEYVTQSGDSLWRVAQKLRPSKTVSLAKMMTAIFEKNKAAFINQDPSRIKAAVRIDIPSTAEIVAARNVIPQKSVADTAEKQRDAEVVPDPQLIQVNVPDAETVDEKVPVVADAVKETELLQTTVVNKDETQSLKDKIYELEQRQLLLMEMLQQRNETLLALQKQQLHKKNIVAPAANKSALKESLIDDQIVATKKATVEAQTDITTTSLNTDHLFSNIKEYALLFSAGALLVLSLLAYLLLRSRKNSKAVSKPSDDTNLPYWQLPVKDYSHVKVVEDERSKFNRPQLSLVTGEKDAIDHTIESSIELSELSMKHGAYDTAIKIIESTLEEVPGHPLLTQQLQSINDKYQASRFQNLTLEGDELSYPIKNV